MKQEPKKEKEYTIGFLIFLIISATVIGVLFINSLNCCIPETSKFNAEIWGTVSDWFTYLVALIGGVFIYKTLNSQMKVQSDQEKINKLNSYDIRSKYLPKILPNQQPINGYKDIYWKESLRQLFFIIENNDALYITIKSKLEVELSHESHKYIENGLFCYDISMLIKDTKFYLIFDDKIYKKFMNDVHPQSITPFHFTKIDFIYQDIFMFKYSISYTYEYQPFSGFVTIRESNLEYLD